MFRTEISRIITDLRYALCPPSRPEQDGRHKGIIFNLTLDLSDYREDGTSSLRQFVQILFCGNTSVFYRKSDWPFTNRNNEMDSWVNTCNHDSCWRSDGLRVLNQMYFEMAEAVNSEKAPISLHDHSGLGVIGSQLWDLVWVQHERDPDDQHRYKRRLVKLEAR